jgi:hypothetical protein
VSKEVKDFFEVEDVGHGDEFGAVKPWLGAIKEPSDHPPINKNKTAISY